ncbi:phosphoribosylformylglycinamidine cyclo-ligase [Striga asiatica]|uniref:Phosphoribosylformylglycinamidine cyclo-ligase n=1 Tax=Striga asiatica TaxID=4170 RepID=A0A5A7QDV0_STRAF|nr:phosphoribosylformylglycinamidine cyclo-ligase [Striga asiatica]
MLLGVHTVAVGWTLGDGCSLEVSMCNSSDIDLALPVKKRPVAVRFLQPSVGGALRLPEDKQSVAAVRGVTGGVSSNTPVLGCKGGRKQLLVRRSSSESAQPRWLITLP